MGAEVRKKAMQRFEVVFKAQVEAWQTLLTGPSGTGRSMPLDAARHGRLIVGAASGMAKQRLRGWVARTGRRGRRAGRPDVLERAWRRDDSLRRRRFAVAATPAAVASPRRRRTMPLTLRGVPQGTCPTPLALT